MLAGSFGPLHGKTLREVKHGRFLIKEEAVSCILFLSREESKIIKRVSFLIISLRDHYLTS